MPTVVRDLGRPISLVEWENFHGPIGSLIRAEAARPILIVATCFGGFPIEILREVLIELLQKYLRTSGEFRKPIDQNVQNKID